MQNQAIFGRMNFVEGWRAHVTLLMAVIYIMLLLWRRTSCILLMATILRVNVYKF